MSSLRRAVEVLDLRLLAYRGCLVREPVFDTANIDTWLESTGGDVTAVERVVNHVHLYDLVEELSDTDLPALEDLARRIAQLWTDTLQARYPEYRAVVSFASEPDEYGPTLTLHQDSQQ
jgi:hypothetical protein